MIDFAAEAAYKARWLLLSAQRTPIELALAGGAAADRLSFVFIAGYQAAQRLCFADLADDQWYSFAVSEDRRGIVPGVRQSEGRLNGTKTWVAAAENVDTVLVTDGVRMGAAWQVDAGSPATTIEVLPPGDFLADLSVGRLHLDGYTVAAPLPLGFDFGLAEAYCMLGACAGHLQRMAGEEAGVDPDLLELVLADLRGVQAPASEIPRLVQIQAQIKLIARTVTEQLTGSPHEADWQLNGRLFGMYGRGLKSRLES